MGNLLEAESRIINELERREKRILSPHATLSKDGRRRYPERFFDLRPSFSRDADRIFHSFAFQKYIGRNQCVYLAEDDFRHHAATCLQLVLKISKIIARALALNEDLTEAIALGHDIGHAPFGHAGETELSQEVVRSFGDAHFHFRQNVQAIRFLDDLEGYHHQSNGRRSLNLTIQVLDGILCHRSDRLRCSVSPQREKTWADFDIEVEKSKNKEVVEILPMTLEGCLLRSVGFISRLLMEKRYAISYGILHREDFPDELGTSYKQIVNNISTDIIENSLNKDEICFSAERYEQINIFADFIESQVRNHPMFQAQQDELKEVYHTLFSRLLKQVKKREQDSPIVSDYIKFMDNGDPGKSYYRNTPPEMIVIDYLSVS